jgi:hypothetical protein
MTIQNKSDARDTLKIKFFLSTPLKRIGGIELSLHSFSTSALDRDELLTSSPDRLTRGTH